MSALYKSSFCYYLFERFVVSNSSLQHAEKPVDSRQYNACLAYLTRLSTKIEAAQPSIVSFNLALILLSP